MELVQFPASRVAEINHYILNDNPGYRGHMDLGKLSGALARIDNAIVYDGLDDVFLIAAKYARAISTAHAFSDANKRTGLAVCLEYLSLNEYAISQDSPMLATAMVDLVTAELGEAGFADILYALWLEEQKPG